MSVTVMRPPKMGNLGTAITEAYAYLCSPSRIDFEIAYLVQQQALGDASEAITVQLADWRAIREMQQRLFAAAS